MTQNTLLQMRIADEIIKKLDDLRRDEKDIPTRSEMVRRLIERAAEKKRK
jgi:metal-responsive CopG/Arc/MetJ family transcriptional regulator